MSANFSFWNMACQQLDRVAKQINLDPNIHAKMRHCQRALVVSVPIRMDDGSVKVFLSTMPSNAFGLWRRGERC